MGNDNYSTDDFLKDIFEGWFDPCPLDHNPKVDGLKLVWEDKTFVNPPYSKPLLWVNKAIQESKMGKTIVMLLKMDTSTEWFKRLQEANARFLWINKRLKFNTGTAANFPSMLAILNKNDYK